MTVEEDLQHETSRLACVITFAALSLLNVCSSAQRFASVSTDEILTNSATLYPVAAFQAITLFAVI